MAITTEMVYVQMPEQRGNPGSTWKINPRDTARLQQLVDAGGIVISGAYETKAEPVSSHSDQAIDQVNALLDAIPALTDKQAQAIVAAGYTLATIPVDKDQLEEISGIGPATADAILEALSE